MEKTGTAVDAINDALETGSAGEGEGENEELDIPLDDEEGGEEGDDDEAGDEGDDEGGEEGGEEDDGEGLDEDGKPIRQAPKPDKKDDEKPGKKKSDPINDPIPKDLKQETQDRMRSLVNTARTLTAERDQVRNEFETIVKGIQSTGATPEQYGEVLSWVQLFNSPNIEAKKQAYQLVEDVAARMALSLGIERNIGDPVAEFPDLKAALAAGKITPELARETARHRKQAQFQQQTTQHQQQQQQTAAERQKEITTARADLTKLEQQLKATDPLYERKRAQLVPILRPMFSLKNPNGVRPSQWAAAFQEAYKNVRVARTGPLPGKKPLPKGNGMRPKGSAAGKGTAPASALDAMTAALTNMGGGK